jgi:hypothetical protein
MKRRAEAKAVAGCFDVDAAAKARGEKPPAGEQVRPGSNLRFVAELPSGGHQAKQMNCYATPEGQLLELTAMQDLRRMQPDLSLTVLVAVDERVEQHIADLQAKGYTLDAAVYVACCKSPELYATAAKEALASAPKETAETPSGKLKPGKRASDRTPEEEGKAARNRIDQQSREIANLKARMAGGKGKGGGKGGGKGSQQLWQSQQFMPPWQMPNGGGGAWNSGGWQQQQRVPCPDDHCKDYNFKVQGCTMLNCQKFHKCCACGGAHPYRGNF